MRIFLSISMLLLLTASVVWSFNVPVEAVKTFERGYGTAHMDQAADVTTAGFRDGKPKSVWVSETWKILQELEYKKLNSEIIETKMADDRAVITTNATIQAGGVESNQVEVYILQKQNDRWLIDDLHVADEKLEPEETSL